MAQDDFHVKVGRIRDARRARAERHAALVFRQAGVRGVRLYQDDIPVTMPDGQGQTGSFSLLSAGRIEVLRGPFSTLYGNASGGVISVYTENGTAEPVLSFTANGGSYDTVNVGVKATGIQDGVGYVGAYSWLDTNGYRDHSAATRRIANAKLDATFLLADVEIVATYTLYNINRTKLENLIHRIFDPARLDIEIKDRFGNPVIPREWFLVPRFVVDDAVERIKDGTITGYVYDPKSASLVKHSASPLPGDLA